MDTLKEMINEATEQVQSCDLEWAQEELPGALWGFQQRPVGQRILSAGGKPSKWPEVTSCTSNLSTHEVSDHCLNNHLNFHATTRVRAQIVQLRALYKLSFASLVDCPWAHDSGFMRQ